MSDRSEQLKKIMQNCYLWEELCRTYSAQEPNGQETEPTALNIELFLYVCEAEGPEELDGLRRQYGVIEEISKNNFSRFMHIYDDVEGFAKKVLYLADREKYDGYKEYDHKGTKAVLMFLEFIRYGTHDNKQEKLNRIFDKVCKERNTSTHDAPMPSPAEISELVWKSIFTELWVVKRYEDKLKQAMENARKDAIMSTMDEVREAYLKHETDAYEQIQKSGFKYIQIEYENSQNPEEDVDASGIAVVKGTADTLLESIHFEDTPAIKLIAEAGMGKTKMLEYLNYKLSVDAQRQSGSIVPIMIICNDVRGDLVEYDFKKTVQNKLQTILEDTGYGHISAEDFLEYLQEQGKVMYLLDGLNEIIKSNMDKSRFVKTVRDSIKGNTDKKQYYLITERYSRGAITVNDCVSVYRLSEITDEIKRQFFAAKGAVTLFERLDLIQKNYDEATQKELNRLLKRPFYLAAFCDMADSFAKVEDEKIPKDKKELMDFFVRELVKREHDKGEACANFMYVKQYLYKLSELTLEATDNRIPTIEVLKGFAGVTQECGLNSNEYSSDHMLALFEQLGFLRCSTDDFICIEDIYAEYMGELLLDSF